MGGRLCGQHHSRHRGHLRASRRMSAVVQHPRPVELVARRQLRRKVEAAVDRLLAILDGLDGGPKAEPWLGATEANVITPQWPRGSTDDCEEDGGDASEIEDEHGDAADLEPSLGGSENPHNRRQWAAGGRHDLEDGDHASRGGRLAGSALSATGRPEPDR